MFTTLSAMMNVHKHTFKFLQTDEMDIGSFNNVTISYFVNFTYTHDITIQYLFILSRILKVVRKLEYKCMIFI